MQFFSLAFSALVATAACTPLAMPAAYSGTLESNSLNARQGNNCTQYCSVAAGCVCTVRPSDCTALYTVESGDTCTSIATAFGNFTVSQLYRWNPSIGQTCFGLQAYVPICINTPWYDFEAPVQPPAGTHYSPEQTPVPIMPGIVSTCKDYELVGSGTRVDELASENGFEEEDFATWNGGAEFAWADYWACVSA